MTALFDVAIIGGGPAGTAAALTLNKRSDVRVAVFERSHLDTPKVGESLSPGARALLHYLGVWDRFEREHKLSLLGSEAAWGSDSLGAMDFILTLHGAGWVLDRERFEMMLAEEAERGGAKVHTGTAVSACRFDGSLWHLDLGGQTVAARYVIDAAGRSSPFSVAAGMRRQRNDALTALTARLPRAPQQAQMTRVEAEEDGWWYAAPLPSGELITCFFSDAERIHAGRLSDPAIWSARLKQTRHIWPLVAGMVDETLTLEALPAFSSLLQGGDPAKPIIAAGDAIAARDPLSSSGIPNALGSGIQAARVAADALFGQGALKPAYLASIAADHSAFLKTHWKTYRTETRWPDAPFWKFRAAQVTRGPDTPVVAKPDATTSIFVPRPVSKWLIEAAQLVAPQADLVIKARHLFPEIPDERLILAIEELTHVA